MKTLLTFIALGLLHGCSTFHVTQIDESPGERTITLDIRATAWFSSAQAITKLKALQTDKTQSFGSDSLSQHGATNVTAALDALTRLLQAVQ